MNTYTVSYNTTSEVSYTKKLAAADYDLDNGFFNFNNDVGEIIFTINANKVLAIELAEQKD